MPKGRRPTHKLVLTSKEENNGKRRYSNVGVAWTGQNGAMSLAINPGVVLDHKLSQDWYINLYPFDDQKSHKEDDIPDDFGDDDIPF